MNDINITGNGPVLARDRIAQVYLKKYGSEETQTRAQHRIDWIVSETTGQAVLDIGCSEGIVPVLLARRGFQVTGVDINPDAIKYANELADAEEQSVRENLTLICGDIFNLNLEPLKFQTVILGEILEHFAHPEDLLNQALKYLAVDGKLVITTPYGYFPDPDHKTQFSMSSFKSLCQKRINIVSVNVLEGYIRFVGAKNTEYTDTWGLWDDAHLLQISEKIVVSEQMSRREKYNQHMKELTRLQEEIKIIKENNLQYSKQLTRHQEENRLIKENNIQYLEQLTKRQEENKIINQNNVQYMERLTRYQEENRILKENNIQYIEQLLKQQQEENRITKENNVRYMEQLTRYLEENRIINENNIEFMKQLTRQLEENKLIKENNIQTMEQLKRQQTENKLLKDKNTQQMDQLTKQLEKNIQQMGQLKKQVDENKLLKENNIQFMKHWTKQQEETKLLKDKNIQQTKQLTRQQEEIRKIKENNIQQREKLANIYATTWYQTSKEILLAVNKPGLNSLLLPFKLLFTFFKWMRGRKLKTVEQDKKVISVDQTILPRMDKIEEKSITVVKKQEAEPFDQEKTCLNAITEFINKVNAHPETPVVIISSGIKRMEDVPKRLNRPGAFAKELSRMNIPVMMIYYRFKVDNEPVNYHIWENFIQIPNDIFHKNSEIIAAALKNKQKLFICSIPDVNSVYEITIYKLNNWVVAYEVRDEWEAFFEAGVGKWYDIQFEKFIGKRVDFITTVSVRLQEKLVEMGASRQNIHVVPNGLDKNFYESSREIFNRRRTGYRGSGIIGYFGHLTDKWFNWDLLISVAEKRSDFKFEIIGFDAPINLRLPSNIVYLGPKTHPEIISISSNWDLAIVPFKQSALARAVDPIKIYEYFSLGLPCVSCLMDQIVGYPMTFIYDQDQNFVETIDQALAYRPSAEDWQKVEGFVDNSSWEKRVITTLNLAGIKKDVS